MNSPHDLEKLRRRLSALIDGELAAGETEDLRREIAKDDIVRREYEALRAMREDLKDALEPPEVGEEEWDALFLEALSRRSERLGWFLLVPGVVSLLLGASATFFLAGAVPLWVRICTGAITAGMTFLGLAVVGERLRARRLERYDEVKR